MFDLQSPINECIEQIMSESEWGGINPAEMDWMWDSEGLCVDFHVGLSMGAALNAIIVRVEGVAAYFLYAPLMHSVIGEIAS